MTAAGRVGRFYTAARRHPWVLGKVADWKIPLGPYTPAQIGVAVVGGFLLIKTIGWWSWMGPVPLVVWLLAIWGVRRPRIRGRAPMLAALGWVLLGWQPQGGRIGGRAARDRGASPLLGGFTIEEVPRPTPTAPSVRPAPRPAGARSSMPRHSGPVASVTAGVGPVSGVQQLLNLAGQSGGVR